MTIKISITAIISAMLIFTSCNNQKTVKEHSEISGEVLGPELEKKEPHRYGGWYCPDNFGFTPVDIQNLDQVPAVANRLPSEQELRDHMSLISLDTVKYPNGRALHMALPRIARIYSDNIGMNELVIVIQAITVDEDTVVGYRFPNGGNGSARLNEVTFLSEKEVAELGPQPFFYATETLKAPKEEIWMAIAKTDYFKQLGEKFDKQEFFASEWTSASEARLNIDTENEKAKGYVGTVFGNAYLQIDYNRNGFHYSEKILLIENQEDNTTEIFAASGPFPNDFDSQKLKWDNWFEEVKMNIDVN